MTEELRINLSELDKQGDELISVGKRLLENHELTEFNLFCIAILNRTINLNRGFVSLIKEQNYIAAAPLVRLNIDSLLRLFASSQSEFDYETFANKVRNGEKIAMMLDSEKKKKLGDSELVKRLKKIPGFSWVNKIYDIGSGFVHFSNQHIYSSLQIEGNGIISSGIRKNDEFITDSEKTSGAHYMIQSTKGICVFIKDWLEVADEARLPNKS